MEPSQRSTSSAVDEAFGELERVADEIRVKLHLASLDAKETWAHKLEPRLYEVRRHARDATKTSAEAIKEIVETFRAFASSL